METPLSRISIAFGYSPPQTSQRAIGLPSFGRPASGDLEAYLPLVRGLQRSCPVDASGGSVAPFPDVTPWHVVCVIHRQEGQISDTPNSQIAEPTVSRRAARHLEACVGRPDGTHARSRDGGSRVRSAHA